MKLTVFGANGPTGRLLTRRALAEGHHVVAVTRRPDHFPIEHARLGVGGADVHDGGAVRLAVTDADAVLSTLGSPFTRAEVTVYSQGSANIMAAMRAAGVRRLVCVTSSAMAPHPEPLGGILFERVVQPYVVKRLGRTVYDDMRRMESMVSTSGLDWTIVRPSGLFGAPSVSHYEVALDHIGHRFTARVDLADCMLRAVTEGSDVGAAIAVATTAAEPSMAKLLWREGFRKGRGAYVAAGAQ